VDLQPPVLEVKLNESPFKLNFSARKSQDGNGSGGYKNSGLTLAPPPPVMSRLDSGASTESPDSAMYGTPSGSIISFNRDSTYESSSSRRSSKFRNSGALSIAFLSEKGEDEWSTSVFNAVDSVTAPSSPQVNVTSL